MRSFWKAIALFAYRRWRRPQDEMPTEVPGNRDPSFPCCHYDPAPTRDGFDCKGDGHYLCPKCAHFRPVGYFDPKDEGFLDKYSDKEKSHAKSH